MRLKRPSNRQVALYAVVALTPLALTILLMKVIIGWALAQDRPPDWIAISGAVGGLTVLVLGGSAVATAGLAVEIIRILREPRRIDVVR